MEGDELLSALHAKRKGRPGARRGLSEEFARQKPGQGDLLREALDAPGRPGEIRRRAADAGAVQFEMRYDQTRQNERRRGALPIEDNVALLEAAYLAARLGARGHASRSAPSADPGRDGLDGQP